MKNLSRYLLFLVCHLCILGCSSEDPKIATLTTIAVTGITTDSANSGGVITDDGGTEIIQKGVCWSTEEMPTIADHKTTDGPSSFTFNSDVEGLDEGTKYYLRSYATNSVGTSYGNQIEFQTLPEPECRIKEITLQGSPFPFVKYNFLYDDDGRLSNVARILENGAISNERYVYSQDKIEVYTRGFNADVLQYEFEFSENKLTRFIKYYTATQTDINRLIYNGDESITIILDKPFGPDQSLIPIDSTIYQLNANGNISSYTRWGARPDNRSEFQTLERILFEFDSNDNPLRGLFTNFYAQTWHIDFVKFFNKNNAVQVNGRFGYADYSVSYELDQSISKVSLMNEVSNGYAQTYTYENCESN